MLPLQGFATDVVAEVIRRQPLTPAKATFAWSIAVGPAIARATTVELRDGILHVMPKDARWAAEIERAAATILTRVQLLLGAGTVTALRVRTCS
ncbi:MAG TPA: DciA family protein [Vicinamibacterales bacterium]|nr:DciA family protein [Vicinamibacterales bacterium]